MIEVPFLNHDQINSNKIEEKEMSLVEHLDELRWHLLRAFVSLFVFSIIAFFSKNLIFNQIILSPSRTDFWTYQQLCKLGKLVNSSALCIDNIPFIIQSRQMTGQFMMHISSSVVIGLICAFPYAFWEMWKFINPALYPRERKITRGATFFVSMQFIMGILFGYFLVAPVSINFLGNYQVDPSILNEFDITSYIGTLSMLVLSCGLIFQLPVVVYFLTLAGFVSPAIMKAYQKHAVFLIFIVSAMLTPPDVLSMFMLSLPLIILYQWSIIISRMVLKRKKKSEMQDLLKEKPV